MLKRTGAIKSVTSQVKVGQSSLELVIYREIERGFKWRNSQKNNRNKAVYDRYEERF